MARPLRWAAGWGGLALGVLPAAVAMMMGVFAGRRGLDPRRGVAAQWGAQVGKTVLILPPRRWREELMFRGLPLVVAARAIGRGRAVLLLPCCSRWRTSGTPT